MKDFEHINVMSLIGLSVDDEGLPMLVIPLMSHGDLLKYIRDKNNFPTVKQLIEFAIQVRKTLYLKIHFFFINFKSRSQKECLTWLNRNTFIVI
jgi:Protein tyrosine and serine/threonine kinase